MIPDRVRRRLRERADNCCEACGRLGATNAHHRRNQSQGGADTLSNLLLLCGSGTTGCHGLMTVQPAWATAEGYTLQREQPDPRKVPVWRYSRILGRREKVLLDDDGGIEPL